MSETRYIPAIEELPENLDLLRLFAILSQRPYAFFLDSASGPSRFGRYSFLGCDPFLVFSSKKNRVVLKWRDGSQKTIISDPFICLKKIFNKFYMTSHEGGIPFLSGGVGYFSYDLKDLIEDLPNIAKDDLNIPDCLMGFYDIVIIYNHHQKRAYIASSGFPDLERNANNSRKKERLDEFKKIIFSQYRRSEKSAEKPCWAPQAGQPVSSSFSKKDYMETVEKIKRYIKKGDIYQANLSQRFKTTLSVPALELYRRLRELSPAPFFSYLDFGQVKVLSSSPERFLLKRGRYIETRPIKGTRPRGSNGDEDLRFKKELMKSAKDLAEHIMIVDLERNDLGIICEYGSVSPKELFALEKYSNVFHLVSTVSGRLKKDVGAIDCLLAAFPGGSITGAPKIRSMEIIEELEPVRRAVYTGAIGYISFDGNMDTSIAIRTFIVKGRDLYFQVGGAIVADSIPEKEYEETIHKAMAMIKALGAEHILHENLRSKELAGI